MRNHSRTGRSTAVFVAVLAAAGFAPAASASTLPQTSITVSAAASLTDAFPAIGKAFTKRYPNITVNFNFAGSNAIVEQLRSGAPVDVVATASLPSMWKAVQDDWASRPQIFARNSMAIATPRGNPAGVRSLEDLAQSRVLTAVCAPTVPCGSQTNRLFAKNEVNVTAITKELDVRAVLGKVMADQVDAGIVYATDVRAVSTQVTAINIPTALNVTTSYPIAVVSESKKKVAARTFINFVRNPDSGLLILKGWGFTAP